MTARQCSQKRDALEASEVTLLVAEDRTRPSLYRVCQKVSIEGSWLAFRKYLLVNKSMRSVESEESVLVVEILCELVTALTRRHSKCRQ